MISLPPTELRARLDPQVLDLRHLPFANLAHPEPGRNEANQSRRAFLRSAIGVGAAGLLLPTSASAMTFELDKPAIEQPEVAASPREAELPKAGPALRLGEIPSDFWLRPRELHLQRQNTKEHKRIVYWRDGKLVPEGYWAACNLLRDVRANLMTYMDPSVLDILRGILGYYEAWDWNYPVIITSGYRTEKTNTSLKAEGAAKNSMHLYGRAVDLYMQRIPVAHLAQLGMHFQRGGVGFYPQRGFVHLDTGRLRTWRG